MLINKPGSLGESSDSVSINRLFKGLYLYEYQVKNTRQCGVVVQIEKNHLQAPGNDTRPLGVVLPPPVTVS